MVNIKLIFLIPFQKQSKAKKASPFQGEAFLTQFILFYPKNEISTPAATAEPITPEILLAIQYCST